MLKQVFALAALAVLGSTAACASSAPEPTETDGKYSALPPGSKVSSKGTVSIPVGDGQTCCIANCCSVTTTWDYVCRRTVPRTCEWQWVEHSTCGSDLSPEQLKGQLFTQIANTVPGNGGPAMACPGDYSCPDTDCDGQLSYAEWVACGMTGQMP